MHPDDLTSCVETYEHELRRPTAVQHGVQGAASRRRVALGARQRHAEYRRRRVRRATSAPAWTSRNRSGPCRNWSGSATTCTPRTSSCAAKSGSGVGSEHRRRERGHPHGDGAGRAGRRHRLDGAAARRDRHRQGAVRDADPRAERAARSHDGTGELRGDPADAHRERAVRPGEGGVHRRAGTTGRALRAGRPVDASSSTRSAICRRTSRSSCCASSRSGRSSGSAARAPIRIDTRIIAATHRNLEQKVARGHASARTCSTG